MTTSHSGKPSVNALGDSTSATASAAASPSPLTADELARFAATVQSQAQTAAAKIPLLGPVVWLMMQQAGTRHLLLSDMEWRVMPALLLEQAKVYTRGDLPLAFVSWARLSADVASRYRAVPHRLSPADWRSGDQIWLIDVVAPFGGVTELLDDLRVRVFPGQAIFQLGGVESGVAKVLEWSVR